MWKFDLLRYMLRCLIFSRYWLTSDCLMKSMGCCDVKGSSGRNLPFHMMTEAIWNSLNWAWEIQHARISFMWVRNCFVRYLKKRYFWKEPYFGGKICSDIRTTVSYKRTKTCKNYFQSPSCMCFCSMICSIVSCLSGASPFIDGILLFSLGFCCYSVRDFLVPQGIHYPLCLFGDFWPLKLIEAYCTHDL